MTKANLIKLNFINFINKYTITKLIYIFSLSYISLLSSPFSLFSLRSLRSLRLNAFLTVRGRVEGEAVQEPADDSAEARPLDRLASGLRIVAA